MFPLFLKYLKNIILLEKIKIRIWYNEIEIDSRDFYVDNHTIGKVIENISVFYNIQATYNPQKTTHTGPLRSNKFKKIVPRNIRDITKLSNYVSLKINNMSI